MKKEIREEIRKNPILYSYLREESYHYKFLLREDKYLKTLKTLAKEKYKVRTSDKIEKLKEQINLINSFLRMIE